jgi:hypothetical protein
MPLFEQFNARAVNVNDPSRRQVNPEDGRKVTIALARADEIESIHTW